MRTLLFWMLVWGYLLQAQPQFTPEEQAYIKAHPVVTLGADYRWPPFEFTDRNGNHSGLASEYARLIERKSGLKVKVVSGVWSDILSRMKRHEFDGLACAVKTDERSVYLRFSDPYLTVPMVIVGRVGEREFHTLHELEGRTVAINRDSYIHEWLAEKYPGIVLKLTHSNEEALEQLSLHQADAYVGNLAVSTYIINKYLLNNLSINAKIDEFTTAVSVAIDRENPLLYGIIAKSLAAISPREEQAIRKRWRENLGPADQLLNFTQAEREWIESHRVIRYVIDNDWEPLEYLSNDGTRYMGIVSSYLVKLEEKTGIDFERLPTDSWAQSVAKINSGEADMYSCVSETPSRKAVTNFTDPYIVMPLVFVNRKDDPFIADIRHLSGQKVVLIEGYAMTELMRRDHPEIDYVIVKNIYEAMERIVKKEADVYIDLLPVMSNYIQKRGFSNLKVAGISEYKFSFSFALRKELGTTGVAVINKVIDSIDQEERDRIYNEWVQVRYDKQIDYTLLKQIVAVFVIIIAASLFWNRRLSVEVAKRKEAQHALKELNKKLLVATNEAESANRAKSEFLSNMSHEIRTPMNAILGFAELLDDALEESRLKSFVKTIRNSGENLLALINDILDLSKIESGKFEIVNRATSLRRLLEELVAVFSLQARQKGLELELEIDDRLPEVVLVDPVRLRQILFNLVGNALKFTDAGHIRIALRVNEVKEHLSKVDLSVSVADSGIGIAPESREKIFDVFEQQANQDVGRYGGTGLGLSISRKLATLMDGVLEVESEPGKGSCFTLTFRHLDIASLEAEEPLEAERWNNVIDFEEAVVLVADDVANNRLLVRESFAGTKVKVLEAQNGREAIETVDGQHVDLVLMDIRMPELDGYRATRQIKERHDIPVIALTASIMPAELERINEHRFDGYLRKPVSRQELYAEVSRFLTPVTRVADLTDAARFEQYDPDTLRALLSELEEDALYRDALTSNDMERISRFAAQITLAASRHGVPAVEEYARQLHDAIDTFDVALIGHLMQEYPRILDQLRQRI